MPTDRIELSLDEEASEDSGMGNLLPGDEPMEPGNPSAENVFFVLLGIVLALAVVGRLLLLYS